MPLNSNFRLPRGQRFFQKHGSYGYGAKSRCGPPRVHLGANGVIGSKKCVKIVKNYHDPKFEFSTTPRSSIFRKKMEVTVMAPNHGGDTLRSILGPMGSHWVKKWVKAIKNTMPQTSNFRLPRWHRFFTKNESYGYGAKSRLGPPRVHLGPMESHSVKKIGQNRKNYHAPKFEFSTTPQSSIFRKKWKLRLWRQITVVNP